MIELYYWPTPNGWKAAIMLEECGLDYQIRMTNIGRGQQFEAPFQELNPNGKIPVIVDHDPAGQQKPLAIFESGAILLYLAKKTGRFLPADLESRTQVIQWLMWQMSGLGPMLGQHGHFLLYAREKIPYAIDRYGREARRLYGVLDTQLGRASPFICGDYSIADMACFPWIMTHKAQGLSLDEFPQVKAWFARVRERPQVQKALAIGREKAGKAPDAQARSVLFGTAVPAAETIEQKEPT